MKPSQSLHRQNYITLLNEAIRQEVEDRSLPFYAAAPRILVDWLGYDMDDVTFIDARDRGVDAWVATETSIEIFQIKTHETDDNNILNLSTFDNAGLNDLRRAKDFLIYGKSYEETKSELVQLLVRRDGAISSFKMQHDDTPILVSLHLILLGNGLTPQAHKEFEDLQKSLKQQTIEDDVIYQFQAVLHIVDNIVDGKWREENRQWKDITGKACSSIELTPSGDFISDSKNAVFYCNAIDLVESYSLLGYQLFEPNVRANIKNSRVNEAIRNSVTHQRSRREFRFLNNGVTITCDQFTKPKQQKPVFRVKHPGIVNGLQTVVALHTAYDKLDDREQQDFKENCHVLVRLLRTQAVQDITDVVKATNNQNPMRPRNLVSNTVEQLELARLFADNGWFYEAKQEAWSAFEQDYQRWRPNLNKRPRDFRGVDKRKVRKIDNERLAQTWLAFIGFAPEAINRKKQLFEDPYYSLIFKRQPKQHGFTYESLSKASKDAMTQAPHHHLMLVSYLSNEFARQFPPSRQQNRDDACRRLGIDLEKMSKAEVDVRLIEDDEFVLNQALKGMSMLFTEFLGYLLYTSLNNNLQDFATRILSNHSLKQLTVDYSMESINMSVENEEFDTTDILIIAWLAFVDTIEDMLIGGWGQSYRAANIKVRFIFSKQTRELLYRNVDDLDSYMRKRPLKKSWAAGVPEGQGIFDFIREICFQ